MIHIYDSSYKDVFGIAVETEFLRAIFLPYNGAKLASLTDKTTGCELLAAAAGDHYKVFSAEEDYVDSECSAFDDMFPTIDLYIPANGPNTGVSYMDHGEVCRSRFDYQCDNDRLFMVFKSNRLPYRYIKTVSGTEDGSLAINYKIENLSGSPFPYIWAAHCMLAAVENGRMAVPYIDGAQAEIMFDENSAFGKKGDIISVIAPMLTSEPFSADGNTFKYYFTEPVPFGLVKYANPETGRSFVIRYNKNKIPYLGVWMNNGRFKSMHNAAPEICSAPFDSPEKAAQKGYGSSIAPYDSVEFDIFINTEGYPHE